MSKELNKAPVEQAEPASCQGTNCGTTTGDHSSECLAEAAASQGWELKPGDLCGRDCPMRPDPVEQAGGDERAAFEAWLAQAMSKKFEPEFDLAKYEDSGEYRYSPAAAYWKAWQARAALAQPSPVQAEQAEAERPPQPERYTADVFHPERPYYMAQTSVVRASDFDEFATQYERIVGALRFERQQMDRAFTACINEAHAKLAGLYEAAQAQHSVPEEFSFEYRHPNGECHTVTVSREQVINEMPDFLFEALCSKFCNCEPVGETNVVECCCDEYAEEFKLIASAPGKEGL